jgi:ABC-type dipeptide/oligopeptide/nickel transport system ATPase component
MESKEFLNPLEIEDFKWKKHSKIFIVSKTNSGKSVLGKHILSVLLKQHDYQQVIVFSATAKYSKNESFGFIDHKFIFEDVSDDVLLEIMKHQKAAIKKNKDSSIILVFDDIYLDVKSKVLTRLININRHLNLCIILIAQYSKTMFASTSIRSNIDYLLFSNISQQSLEGIYHAIFTEMNMKEFYRFVHQNNKSYNFIMYDNTYKDPDLKFFQIKARELPDVKLKKKAGAITYST